MGNILGGLEKEFPIMSIDEFGTIDGKTRNRVTPGNALLTMVLTAIQEDKTLKNSVDLYYFIHQQNMQQAKDELKIKLQQKNFLDEKSSKKRVGRPKGYKSCLPKSLDNNIFLNTAAYN